MSGSNALVRDLQQPAGSCSNLRSLWPLSSLISGLISHVSAYCCEAPDGVSDGEGTGTCVLWFPSYTRKGYSWREIHVELVIQKCRGKRVMLTNTLLFVLGCSRLRTVVKTNKTKNNEVFCLFANWKCSTSGPAKICSGCLSYRLHHFYLCFLVLFPAMKITQLDWHRQKCFIGCVSCGRKSADFPWHSYACCLICFSEQRWELQLKCGSLYDGFTFCNHHQLYSVGNNNR